MPEVGQMEQSQLNGQESTPTVELDIMFRIMTDKFGETLRRLLRSKVMTAEEELGVCWEYLRTVYPSDGEELKKIRREMSRLIEEIERLKGERTYWQARANGLSEQLRSQK
jgi:predicted nuclease with TOPRIM domain